MTYVKKFRNNRARNMFKMWHEDSMHPSIKEISHEIGISYTNLIKWKNGKKDYDIENIKKVESFLRGRI